jgi:hypothetical protein
VGNHGRSKVSLFFWSNFFFLQQNRQCVTNRSPKAGIAPFARQQELWPGAGAHSARNLTYTWAVGRQRLGGGGASGQGNMSGLVRRYWLGKFVVGGVPLCYGINRAIERIYDAPFEVPGVRCVP